ncbi:FMN-binding protein [Cellulomonas rhizosphaerae]|uniref:FMN-binding protein n=2 Tax=Cellulomonas rhizosphaerae TaxID=2293719 RepID=A0A413RIP2_9CELL|nr:FMN-binding protein [Cellulomonas rhizosphaerae]
MAAAGIAKFAGVAPEVAAAPAATATTGSSGVGSPDAGSADSSGSSDSGTTDGSAGTDSGTDTGGDASSSSDDVTIVGDVEQTRYGPIQLSVTFSGDTITDITALQTPSRERESERINQQAVPVLTQEALAAQSAQIDTVSGATYTSQGYLESLQSAIDQRG